MAEFCKNTVLPLNQSRPVLDIINVNVSSLMDVCRQIEISATDGKYSEPMVVIGYYIMIASALCLFAMVADFIFGVSRDKYWFPCKCFSLNAASLTLIAVTLKLPMDLSSPMSDDLDQVAKVGGLGFLCVMMANFMPSLASMDNRSLLANVTGLFILVITLIVDVGIQIKTELIFSEYLFMITTCIYMGMLLFLLIVLISCAITIPTSNKIIELKYQDISTALNDPIPQGNKILTVEQLKDFVKRYWIMVETGNPQFVVASTPLSSASAIICAVIMVMHILLLSQKMGRHPMDKSVYKHSTSLILVIQTTGILFGSVAPIFRCFTALRFKSFANQNRNCCSVFKVEKYWTQKLCEWKESPITLFGSTYFRIGLRRVGNFHIKIYRTASLSRSHSTGIRISSALRFLRTPILSFCIIFQNVVVVSCKIIDLIPIVISKALRAMLFTKSSDDSNADLRNYVLLLQDDGRFTGYSVKNRLSYMNNWTQIKKTTDLDNLLLLLNKSDAFDGVKTFDTNQFPSTLPVELVNSWSLPIISLTCIALVIPNIGKDLVDKLFIGVDQGLSYTHIVEESLNRESEYVSIRRATLTWWHDVENSYRWLETSLERSAYVGKKPTEIIKLFADEAKYIIDEFIKSTNHGPVVKENLPPKVIAANSMYRIAQTIMHTYESNLEIIEDELFRRLSGMIADILAACLTNIPRVIIMKCRESAIERREASIALAAFRLVRASKILEKLEARELPNMDRDKMGFIDEWRLHLMMPL